MKPIAHLVSFLFHPLLLPTYAAGIIIVANPAIFNYLQKEPLQFLVIILFNTVIMPGIVILIMKPLGFIKSFYMEDRSERILPYVASLFFYIWTFILFYKDQFSPAILNVIVLGALIALFIAFMANTLFMKVSIHTAGMGVLIGLLLAMTPVSDKNLFPILLLAILVAGLVGTARLILKSRSQQEIYAGYLVGLFSQLIAIHFIY